MGAFSLLARGLGLITKPRSETHAALLVTLAKSRSETHAALLVVTLTKPRPETHAALLVMTLRCLPNSQISLPLENNAA